MIDFDSAPGSGSDSSSSSQRPRVQPYQAPDVDVAHLLKALNEKQREAVLAFLVERENGSARVVLGEMLRERRRPDDVLLLALASALDTALGRAAFAAVRAGWRHALKPAIARFARTPS